jgi:endonuclease/exonuclease/phosphatase family metal-dependent hydrolase
MLPIRVMTFNINGNDLEIDLENMERSWANRADLTLKTIRSSSPDLIGLQEVVHPNLEFFQEHLTDYAYELGQEYDEGEYAAYSSILWKRARFELIESGKFWFSRTPDVRSSDWGVPYPMGAAWVRLQEVPTGMRLLHMNTHFEDGLEGEQSRMESSKLVVARVRELAPDIPAIVTGDFNCNPRSAVYNRFIAAGFIDTYLAAGNIDGAASTFHGYAGEHYNALEWGGSDPFWRIDWILVHSVSQPMQVRSCTIIRDAETPLYPSDHYPVIADLLLNP